MERIRSRVHPRSACLVRKSGKPDLRWAPGDLRQQSPLGGPCDRATRAPCEGARPFAKRAAPPLALHPRRAGPSRLPARVMTAPRRRIGQIGLYSQLYTLHHMPHNIEKPDRAALRRCSEIILADAGALGRMAQYLLAQVSLETDSVHLSGEESARGLLRRAIRAAAAAE